MTAPRLVVFDVDGTLVDSQDHIHAAMELAFRSIGQPVPSRTAILSIVGLSLPVAIERLVPDLNAAAQSDIVEAYKGSFGRLRLAGPSPLFAGVADLLSGLRRDPQTLLGIATGKSRRGLSDVLEAHGLSDHFLTTQVADDHPSKPHPSMLHAALAETGVAARNAVMIGDTSYDIQMGIAAGIRTIGVSWGYHPAEALSAAGAGCVVDTTEMLRAAIDRIEETA